MEYECLVYTEGRHTDCCAGYLLPEGILLLFLSVNENEISSQETVEAPWSLIGLVQMANVSSDNKNYFYRVTLIRPIPSDRSRIIRLQVQCTRISR